MADEIKKVGHEAEWITKLLDKLVQDHEEAIAQAKLDGRQIPPAADFDRDQARKKFRIVYGDDTSG